MTRRILLGLAVLAAFAFFGLAGCTPPGTDPSDTTGIVLSDITTATTLTTGKVYTVEGTVTVSAKLTVEAGTTIRFTNYSNYGSELIISAAGQIVAVGTKDSPIVFTSSKDVTGGTPAAGDWGRVQVSGSNSTFTYCTFMYAGNGGSVAALEIGASNATVSNCTFARNVIALDASAAGEATTVSANAFYGNTGGIYAFWPVSINANVALDDANSFTDADGNNANTCQGIEYSGSFSLAQTLASTKAAYVIGGVPGVSAKLTINPGVTLKFTSYSNYGSGLTVTPAGRIDASGTSAMPIKFTSVKDGGTMTPARKDWGGIELQDGTDGCIFTYCTFSYSGNGDGAALSLGTATNATVANCTFAHNVYGIYDLLIGAGTVESGNAFSDNSLGDYVP
jgi:plastocyanin